MKLDSSWIVIHKINTQVHSSHTLNRLNEIKNNTKKNYSLSNIEWCLQNSQCQWHVIICSMSKTNRKWKHTISNESKSVKLNATNGNFAHRNKKVPHKKNLFSVLTIASINKFIVMDFAVRLMHVNSIISRHFISARI